MSKTTPIADTIPLEKAWQTGRRVYVRCGYNTATNQRIRALGATWDREVKALWVGSTKKQQVVDILTEIGEAVAAVEAIKGLAFWVAIPYAMRTIRDRAKALGGKWDSERKEWAMPTHEARDEIVAAIAAEKRAVQERKEERAVQERKALPENAIKFRGALPEDMFLRRAAAEQYAPKVGDRIKVDGRLIEVVTIEVVFGDTDFWGSVMCQPWRDAGWAWFGSGVPVEPTPEERAADEARAARAAAERELTDLLADSPRRSEVAHLTPVSEPVVTITRSGVAWTVTLGGELWVQSRGSYDDYRCTEVCVTDPDIIQRIMGAVDVLGAGRFGRPETVIAIP